MRGGDHPNVLRQPGVESQQKFRRQQRAFAGRRLKVRYHAKGVDAGICATGAVESGTAREEFGQGHFNFLLHPRASLLHLPACVIGTLVGDGEFEFEQIHKELTTDKLR